MRFQTSGAPSPADGDPGSRLFLVSCVKTKRATAAPAKDLYISPWFRKARACVEKTGCPWRILSAKYGLVHPGTEIAPYEETLTKMSAAERRVWADEALARLDPCLAGVETVVFFAGQHYRKLLVPALRERGLAVEIPMRGLSWGEQLRWLGACLQAPPLRSRSRPAATVDRLADTRRFYELLARLERRLGGRRRLADCAPGRGWPKRGVYFFFEDGETRCGSGTGLRVVRVGTHGLKAGGRSTLWQRLAQHRGKADGSGGNHRGSVFRKLLGAPVTKRNGLALPKSWGVGSSPGVVARKCGLSRSEVTPAEAELERRVSRTIGAMPFLWLGVPDEPGPGSDRGIIERNAIALLSGNREPAPDPPSRCWLGRSSDRPLVRGSGLWNNNHVGERHDPCFLDLMEQRIAESRP